MGSLFIGSCTLPPSRLNFTHSLPSPIDSIMVAVKLQKEENRKAFLDLYPALAEEVLGELRKYNMPEDAYEWTKEVSVLVALIIVATGVIRVLWAHHLPPFLQCRTCSTTYLVVRQYSIAEGTPNV